MADKDRIPVILSGARTPIGRFLGGLSSLEATRLGAIAVRAAVDRAGIDPGAVEDVIMGNVVAAGGGQAPARQAAIHGGIPASVPAVTVNKVCGSGLKAVMLAAQAIKAGDLQVAVTGGFESMSNVPHYLRNHRAGVKFGDQTVQDGLIYDGLWCSFGDCHMGGHAEYTAQKAGITREEADEYAFKSHMKAVAAIEGGKFKDEIVGVEIHHRKGTAVVDADEGPRKDTTMEALARLRPAFPKDAPEGIENLVVTAGNAPGLNDGAAALVVSSQSFAEANGIPIQAFVSNYSVGSTEPRDLFFAPIHAIRKLMAKDGKGMGDYGLFEVNEAFSVQALADMRELEMPEDRVNVHGGAVALGHPIGASGARILVTLLYALRDRGESTGMAALCLGGGNAVALSVELR
jgi:acetyl-CoA C-acetyltransferase